MKSAVMISHSIKSCEIVQALSLMSKTEETDRNIAG